MRVDAHVVEYSKVLKEIFSREVDKSEANEETVRPARTCVVATNARGPSYMYGMTRIRRRCPFLRRSAVSNPITITFETLTATVRASRRAPRGVFGRDAALNTLPRAPRVHLPPSGPPRASQNLAKYGKTLCLVCGCRVHHAPPPGEGEEMLCANLR